ncbi:MAG: hypothetical protein U1F53_09020 [Burkholderiaceae bacterium]
MPIVGLGLHVLIAIFFAIHAVRSGQQTYWLFILFSFPLLGSIVYFLAIYLPDSRLERGARQAVAKAAKALDPTRELREARAAFEYTPTAQHQMRLAAALLDAGQAEEAATNYEACLKGPFASDLEIRWGAAQAWQGRCRGKARPSARMGYGRGRPAGPGPRAGDGGRHDEACRVRGRRGALRQLRGQGRVRDLGRHARRARPGRAPAGRAAAGDEALEPPHPRAQRGPAGAAARGLRGGGRAAPKVCGRPRV